MEMVMICGIAVTATIIAVLLKKYNPEYSVVISLLAGVLTLFLILSKLSPAISEISNLLAAAGMANEYGAVLFKALGVCFLAQFAADSCRDAGESALASKVELAGKVLILLLALPLFRQVAQIATDLLQG
ncbi:MAG TPA: stage III sporulation protein AD [Candidatus Gallacutalibacter stercoravium]|nr:stage III sporulation protein AD [Candidatus Gallacutalibacter stercoravium]